MSDPSHDSPAIPRPDAGERALLDAWNATTVPLEPVTVGRRIAAQAERTPDAVAVCCGDDSVTYAALLHHADALAARLQALGVTRGSLVAVLLERSIAAIAALLAVWQAGGAYVPLDLELPGERVARMLADCRPTALISRGRYAVDLPGVPAPLLDLDGSAPVGPAVRLEPDASLADVAAVFYTSGSTGRPKGVMQRHAGIANWTAWQQRRLPLAPGDAELQATPLGFGLSVAQIFHPLAVGARLVLVPPDRPIDGPALVETIRRHSCTKWVAVPALLGAALAAGLADCPSLRCVVSTASSLPARLKDELVRFVEVVVTGWGATECFLATAQRCDESPPHAGTVPVGAPIDNMTLHVLDECREPVAIGVPGELWVGGVNLAAGYLGLPEKTGEKFVVLRGQRLYRTGDVARWRPDGALEFIGRGDDQVKIRGVRVEPGDVEAAILRHPNVQEAVVVARTDRGGEPALVAYVVPRRSHAPTTSALRVFLRRVLPEAMIPSVFVVLAALPLPASKKLDRAALPAPGTARPALDVPCLAARDEVEAALVPLWTQALGLDEVGVLDDWFDLGGDSLGAAALIARMSAALDVPLPMRAVLDEFTVAGVAALAKHVRAGGGDPPAGRTPEALAPEVRLDPAIAAGVLSRHDGAPRTVLLTGATGFLGRHMVAALLRHTQARVVCLVRAGNAAVADRRLREVLAGVGIIDADLRVSAVPGDLARPRLGLDGASFAALAADVDEIFHAGAEVNLLLPYAALRATNVQGTAEILRLATTGRLKPVHHVSTIAVGVEHEDGDPRRAPRLPTGYAQTKWVAEMLVREAAMRGVPAAIYRTAEVFCHSETGAMNQADAVHRVLQTCSHLGCIPAAEALARTLPRQWTPVDHVAAAVVLLSQRPPRTYHVVDPHAPRWPDLHAAIVTAAGLDVVAYADWQARLRALNDAALGPLTPLFLEAEPPLLDGGAWLRCEATRQALADVLPCPPLDVHLLRRYFQASLAATAEDGGVR